LYKLIFATSNKGKFEEAKQLLKDHKIKLVMKDIKGLEIQSDNLEEITLFSVIQAYNKFKGNVIVEDDGLFIKALKGFPGPYSSYVYKTLGLKGILKLMKGIKNREAYFLSSLAFYNGKELKLFSGKVDGWISYEVKGDKGFGFDPIFIPKGFDRTFGELNLEEKNKVSHRSKAFLNFSNWLSLTLYLSH